MLARACCTLGIVVMGRGRSDFENHSYAVHRFPPYQRLNEFSASETE